MDVVQPSPGRSTDATDSVAGPFIRQSLGQGGGDLRVLVEKRARSGSTRAIESYARMLWPFFAAKSPDQVSSADVLGFAHGIGPSGRTPSSATTGARIACLSSFYRFGIRMGLLAANPCEALERPRAVPSVTRGFSAAEVRRLLAVVPDIVAGAGRGR